MIVVDMGFWRGVANEWNSKAMALVWPPTCVLCGGAGHGPAQDLCAACEADLPVNLFACHVCAQPLAPGGAVSRRLCGACLQRAPRFDATLCAYRYAYPIDHLIRALKYQGAVVQSRVLGGLLARFIRDNRTDAFPELMIPVPLAQQRFRVRGYNQALELGRFLEKQLHVRLCTELVVRTRETAEQAALKKKERRRNLRGAFALTGKLPAQHIAIVDDVVTTGSTANELAAVLKRAGAQRVEVWAVARAARKQWQ